jgi:hypothetical protein
LKEFVDQFCRLLQAYGNFKALDLYAPLKKHCASVHAYDV